MYQTNAFYLKRKREETSYLNSQGYPAFAVYDAIIMYMTVLPQMRDILDRWRQSEKNS